MLCNVLETLKVYLRNFFVLATVVIDLFRVIIIRDILLFYIIYLRVCYVARIVYT